MKGPAPRRGGHADPLVETRGRGRGEAVKVSLGLSHPIQTADRADNENIVSVSLDLKGSL